MGGTYSTKLPNPHSPMSETFLSSSSLSSDLFTLLNKPEPSSMVSASHSPSSPSIFLYRSMSILSFIYSSLYYVAIQVNKVELEKYRLISKCLVNTQDIQTRKRTRKNKHATIAKCMIQHFLILSAEVQSEKLGEISCCQTYLLQPMLASASTYSCSDG